MIFPAPSVDIENPPIKSSARVQEPYKVEKLDAFSRQFANSAASTNPPEAGGSTDHPEPGGFPQIPGIHWEPKKTGALEAWYSTDGTRRNRANRKYLGQLGKKRMTGINTLAPVDAFAELRRWVSGKATEKGIQLDL